MAEETSQVEAFRQVDFVRLHDWASAPSQEELAFYSRLAAEHGSPVLDVACTTGRLDIPLARQGCEVAGLVCSDEVLAFVQAKLEAEPAEVRERLSFFQQSVEAFDLDRQFPTLIMPDSAVFELHGRFSLTQCFRRLYRHTEPGGEAVIDAVAPEVMAEKVVGLRAEAAQGVNPATGLPTRLIRRVTNVSWDTQMVSEMQMFVEAEGEREREVAFRRDYRWLGRDEGVELLRRAGFPEVEVFGDYDGSPFGPCCPRLILIAHRLERDFI